MESSSHSPESSVEELPSFIKEKIEELEEAERRIDHLQTKLVVAENRRDVIKREIAAYKQWHAGIHKAPTEILSIIFLLIDDEQGVRNYRLSLVCKAWKALIDDTPSMWTQVCVKWSGSLDSIPNSWEYIEVCLAMSKHSSLDITLDFSDQPYYPNYLDQVLQNHFEQMGSGWELRPLKELGFDPDSNTFSEYTYQELAYQTLDKFYTHADHNSRWRSLKLLAPHCGGSLEIPDSVLCQLTELEYCGGSGANHDITEFRALRRLITDKKWFLPKDSHSTLPLKYLDLTGVDATFGFLSAGNSSFRLLKSLTLYAKDMRGRINSGTMVHVPLLHFLRITGDAAYITTFIEAPVLRELHLGLRSLKRFGDTPLLHGIKKLSLRFLSHYSTANNISLFAENFESMLRQCKSLGKLTYICYSDLHQTLQDQFTESFLKVRGEGIPLLPCKGYWNEETEPVPYDYYN